MTNNLDTYLFRGISKETGDWIFGFFLDNTTWPIKSRISTRKEEIVTRYFISTDKCGMVQIQEESLGLWIGYEDQYGVNIFEGDFVGLYDESKKGMEAHPVYEVRWDPKRHGFALWVEALQYFIDIPPANQLRIAGSIHDKLLKKE